MPVLSSEDEHEEYHESYEHKEHHDDDEHHEHHKSQQNRDEFKIYGTIDQIAENGVGIWIIDGREHSSQLKKKQKKSSPPNIENLYAQTMKAKAVEYHRNSPVSFKLIPQLVSN